MSDVPKIAGATGTAGLSGLGFAVNIIWPQFLPQFAVLIGCASILLLLISLWLWFLVIRDWWRKRKKSASGHSIVPVEPEFVSLQDAANTLYDHSVRNGGSVHLAASRLGGRDERLGARSPNDRLDWLATHISRHLSIYGQKISPEGSTLVLLTERDFRNAVFCQGATDLRHVIHENTPVWKTLCVKNAELREKIDKLVVSDV